MWETFLKYKQSFKLKLEDKKLDCMQKAWILLIELEDILHLLEEDKSVEMDLERIGKGEKFNRIIDELRSLELFLDLKVKLDKNLQKEELLEQLNMTKQKLKKW